MELSHQKDVHLQQARNKGNFRGLLEVYQEAGGYLDESYQKGLTTPEEWADTIQARAGIWLNEGGGGEPGFPYCGP